MKETVFTSIPKEELTNSIANKVLEVIRNWSEAEKSSKNPIQLLTREEVAKLCKVKSLSTLWHWKKQGLLAPTSRAGRKPLYKYEDVIEFLEGQKTGSYDK